MKKIILFMLFVVLCSFGFAQTTTEKEYHTKEVVISANRFEESSEKVPQQIAVIKSKKIEQTNVQTTADLLQSTGLVNVQKSQAGGGSPIIRGFEANKVLIVVDGVRMNNAIFRGGHLQNVITMDQSNLERMEVMFGAGSLMYGSDALGGVINFHTKDPKLSDSKKYNVNGSAFTRYSSAINERTLHADFSLANNRFGSLTSITGSNFGDVKQGANRSSEWDSLGLRKYYQVRRFGVDTMLVNSDPLVQKNSGYSQLDLMQKFIFKQNSRITHLLNFQYSTSSDIPRYDRLTETNSSGIFKNAEWYYGPQKRLFASYQARISGSEFFDKGIITLAYQNIEESRNNRSWGKTYRNSRIETVNVYSLNADFDKMYKSFDIQYGLEMIYNDVQSFAMAYSINPSITPSYKRIDSRYPSDGSSTKSASAYVSTSKDLGEKLSLNAGLRFNYYNLFSDFTDKTFFPFPFNEIKQNSSTLTAQIGTVYRPTDTWKISMNLATGYRSPNVDDLSKVFESSKGDTLGSKSTVGTIIVPNPELKAEKTYNAEISISKNIADKFQITGIAFATSIADGIVTQDATFNGSAYINYGDTVSKVQKNVNASKAYILGYCGIINYEITNNFTASGSYNYTYGRITSLSPTTPLDHIAPAFGRASLVWKNKKMRAEFFSLFNAAKKLKDYNLGGEDNLQYATTNGMPPWYTLNLRYSYQVNKYLQAQLSLDNITDNAYRVFASGINAPGRNLGLTVRATF